MNRLPTLTEAKRVVLHFDKRREFSRECFIFRYSQADVCELPDVLAAIVNRGDLDAFEATAIWLAASSEERE